MAIDGVCPECGNKFSARRPQKYCSRLCRNRVASRAGSLVKSKNAYAKHHDRARRVWSAMLERCRSPSCKGFKFYGARGITVCSEWNDFRGFMRDMGDPPDGMSLDRKDNDGPYSPENCRWATQKEQMRNTRSNVRLDYDGATHCIAEWAEITRLKPGTISRRLRVGWPIDKALSTAVA